MCQKCNDRGYLTRISKAGAPEIYAYCDCPRGLSLDRANKSRSYEAAGIFKEFHNKTLADFIPQSNNISHQQFVERTRKNVATVQSIKDTNFIWVIFGTSGTGKTLAAVLVLMEAIKHHYVSRYVVWKDILADRLNQETDSGLIEKLKQADFLVIDGVNKDDVVKAGSQFPAEILDTIMSYRFSNLKPTIIILDTTYDDARRRLPVLNDLVREKTDVSEVTGQNYVKDRPI